MRSFSDIISWGQFEICSGRLAKFLLDDIHEESLAHIRYDSRRLSGFQGEQPLARSQSVPVGTLGNLAFRFFAIGVAAVADWNMHWHGVCLVLAAD